MKNIDTSQAFTPKILTTEKNSLQNSVLNELLPKLDLDKLLGIFPLQPSPTKTSNISLNEKQRLVEASIQKHDNIVKTLRKK
ncbi:MAG: hypothetical protein IKQ31_03200 [Clostridia bacterium]|nr:hypothetical protein [Clostridia bacterium]